MNSIGNILVDNNGRAIVSNNKAYKVTSSIDSNIIPENIKKGTSILGVTGTYESVSVQADWNESSTASPAYILNKPTNISYFNNDSGYLVASNIANKADKITIVNHGTSDTTFTITPNVYHIWGTVTSLTLTLGTATGNFDEYMFEFTSGTTATTLSLPSTIKWQDNPTVEPNKIYQVSIVNNLGLIIGVNS